MIKSKELAARVAIDTGQDVALVNRFIESLMNQLQLGLVHEGSVQLLGVGVISISPYRTNKKMRILRGPNAGAMVDVTIDYRGYFRKSHALRRMLQEHRGGHTMADEEMEKYGVDEGTDQEVLEKRAAEGCPECGETPTRQGNILICPKHGTEPFERG